MHLQRDKVASIARMGITKGFNAIYVLWFGISQVIFFLLKIKYVIGG